MMEEWINVSIRPNIPVFQYSSIPIFQYYDVPIIITAIEFISN